MRDLREEFVNPPTEYRSVPFWAWNAKLSVEEIREQISSMQKQGLGGFFMHSREGLETEYMGTEWMECVNAAVTKAAELGMTAWLYDEDRWPSGFGGGKVPIDDAYRAKVLVVEMLDPGSYVNPSNVIAVFAVKMTEGKIKYTKRLKDGYTLLEDEVGLVFKRKIREKLDRFNGDTYVDNLNPASVERFIEVTHEEYYRRFHKYFGNVIPGVFTDEPTISPIYQLPPEGVPWTERLPEYFLEQRGYDLLELLPYLFFDGDRAFSVRYDFWKTITELFENTYWKRLGEWCEERNIYFTGHLLEEDDFAKGILTNGAIMPHYVHMQLPAVDVLKESISEVLTIKQCASVARQFGRRRVMSELYGCTGWDFSFEGQKWVGDWQYALGVNMRCQHLALYSLKGCRKRDYPPSFHYNTTSWKYYRIVEDYFARLSLVLSSGEPVRDVLVIHPIQSVWGLFNGQNFSVGLQLEQPFKTLLNALLGAHWDFDIGDEMIIDRWGVVDDKKFVINKAKYEVVVIPPMLTIQSRTLDLLLEFLDAGGKVITLGKTIKRIDGRVSSRVDHLYSHKNLICVKDISEAIRKLDACQDRRMMITNVSGYENPAFVYIEVKADSGTFFFVVNTDRDCAHDVRISIKGKGALEEWNAFSGKTSQIATDVEAHREFLVLNSYFGPAESKLFYLSGTERPKACKRTEPYSVRSIECTTSSYTFKRTEPNVLPLDFCRWRIGNRELSDYMLVWQAQREIRRALGMPPIYKNGIEQRYVWINRPHVNDGMLVSFVFEFTVQDIPYGNVYLLAEELDSLDVILNDKQLKKTETSWYVDRSFRTFLLPPLKKGRNTLVLSCKYKNWMEIESPFIIGDFGVDFATNKIIQEPEKLYIGDWCLQGYPYYAGSIVYYHTVKLDLRDDERVIVRLNDYRATVVRITVNHCDAGYIPWRCINAVDITDYVKPGDNIIGIELVGSLRNMLGPLHNKKRRLPGVSWMSFREEGQLYTEDYVVVPYGLMAEVEIRIMSEIR